MAYVLCRLGARAAVLLGTCLSLIAPLQSAAAGPGPASTHADGFFASTNAATSLHPAPLHPPTAGTRRMIELLQKTRVEVEAHPEKTIFLNDGIAAWLRERIDQSTNEQERLGLLPKLATQLLNAGKSELALQEFNRFQDRAAQLELDLGAHNQSVLDLSRAMCYLRIGEQENCLLNHNTDSCLMPIRDGGVHKLQRGSRAAIQVLTEHLHRFPDDLRARWLLNIASMTVGDYPDKLPPQWLIPPKVFESDYFIKRFPDVAADLGLDVEGLAGGCIVEDFDGDGYLDVMLSDWSLNGQLRLFHNNADGTFTERTVAAGLTGIVGGLNMMQTDYNNDGFPDVLILRGGWFGASGHFPKSLLKNNGDGTFEDATEEAGLLSPHPSQTAAWFDYNGDGWLDLFIGNETTIGDTNVCELYRNNGDGTFTECAKEAGVDVVAFIKGVTAGDYNNDGRPDLYLSNRDGPNLLLRNDGPAQPGGVAKSKWKFTNVAAQAGVTQPIESFPCWFWDYDNDGWLDIFVAGYYIKDVGDIAADYLGLPNQGECARLYHNNHDGTFSDVTEAAGLHKILLAMGSNFGDLDNDGWLDFYVGTGNPDLSTIIPNRMFRNAEGKYFQDVTTSGGFGHLQKGHGVAFADFNNDGNQDVFIKIGGAYTGDIYRSAVFLNPGHGNHWITLKLEGLTSNRAAIGARIRVIVDTDKGQRSIYKTVGTGGSFGASPLRQEIGLGQATAIAAVEVYWPVTGKTQVLKGLVPDHFYRVREGDSEATMWNLKSFPVVAGAGTHHHHHQ